MHHSLQLSPQLNQCNLSGVASDRKGEWTDKAKQRIQSIRTASLHRSDLIKTSQFSSYSLVPSSFLLFFVSLQTICNKSSLHLLICLFLTRSISYILSMFYAIHLLRASQIFILTCDSMSFACVFAPIDPDWLVVRGFLWPFFNWSWQCTMANLWLRSIWRWQTRARRVWLRPNTDYLSQ